MIDPLINDVHERLDQKYGARVPPPVYEFASELHDDEASLDGHRVFVCLKDRMPPRPYDVSSTARRHVPPPLTRDCNEKDVHVVTWADVPDDLRPLCPYSDFRTRDAVLDSVSDRRVVTLIVRIMQLEGLTRERACTRLMQLLKSGSVRRKWLASVDVESLS